MTDPQTPAPVGIVGGGPVGLAAALRLASFGCPSVVLEVDAELRKQGSKACLIQGDVLEVLDKVGCGEQIATEGVTWTVARTYVRNREIRAHRYPDRPGFGPFINISQYRIEQVLLERALREPLIEIRWGHEVIGVEQDDSEVRLRVRTADGERTLGFDYVVACDGVRSPMRGFLDVAWTGYTHQDRFLITDIKVKLPLSKERHFHYDPSFNRGRQLVMHPQPDDVWRIDWQLPPDADIDAERRTGRLDTRIRQVIGDVPYEIDWLSTYRFHQRVVERFVTGRVLFAGDAAHALPPYGSRGMNSGIQDADNLAWKLAAVVRGQAPASLLETYHDERYAAARENLRVTEDTIKFMVPPDRLARWRRQAVLRMSMPFPAVRRRVNSGRMAEPFTYRDSRLVTGDATAHPVLGAFAPDGLVTAPGPQRRLRHFFGHRFVAVCFARTAAEVEAVRAATETGLPAGLTAVVVVPADGPAPAELGDRVTVVRDPGALAAGYGLTTGWALVRPDGHVAALGAGTDLAGLAAAYRVAAEPAEALAGSASGPVPTGSPVPSGKESR
ncbi:MAG TPA: FAD-dependent monooxygenase [Jatrophihabitans sp.]|nr:FAD-dependent monooxygenase [Jatrophihabitans sp.]